MKSLRSGEAGQALVMALILLALGAVVMVPTLNLAFTSIKYHELIEGKTLESYSADSGVKYALCMLNNNPNTYHDDPLVLDFTINDRAVNVTAKYVQSGLYQITSRATSVNGHSTTIESYVKLDLGAFTYTVVTKKNMVLANTIIDSSPEIPGEGNIHSNMNITLTGCEIYGDATAVGTISGQDQVIPPGIATEGGLLALFPQDYSELYEQMAKKGGTWEGNYLITEDRNLGPLYINGTLRVEGAVVILEGTVYVTGEIHIEYGTLDGSQTLVAEESIWIEQGAVRSDIIPIILCTKDGGEIYSESTAAVDGVLYAPDGTVRLQSVHLYGAVGAETVDIQYCTITYAKELQGRDDLPGGELHTISYTYK